MLPKIIRLSFFVPLKIFAMFFILLCYSCALYSIVKTDEDIKYGCWCKAFRLEELLDKEPIDEWDEICKEHVKCYTVAGKMYYPFCDRDFINRMLNKASYEQVASINIKKIIEFYWQQLYGLIPEESVFSSHGRRIYFYDGTKICEE